MTAIQFVQLPEEYLKRLVEICLNAKMDGTVLSLALTCKALHKLMLPLLLENVCLMVKPGTPHGDAFESRFDSLASLVTLRQRRPYVRSLAIKDPSILCEVVHHVTIFNHILLSLPNLTHVSLPFHLLTNYTLVALHDSKTISTFVITDFNVDRTSDHFSLDHRRMLAVRPGPRPKGRPRLSIVGLAGTVPTNTTPARIRSFHEYMRNLWVYDIRYTTLRLSIFTHSPPTTAAVQLFHELGPLTTVGAWALPPNPRLETVVLEMGERSLAFGYAWMAKVFGAQPSITRCEVVVLPSGAGSVPPTDGAEPSFDLEGKKGLPFWRDGKMETSVPAAKWAQLPMVEIRAIYAPCAKDRAAEADDDAKKVEWGVKELEVKFAEGASVGVAAVSEFFKEAFVDKRTCERVVMMGGKWNDPAWATDYAKAKFAGIDHLKHLSLNGKIHISSAA